jgi:hypothetical protein
MIAVLEKFFNLITIEEDKANHFIYGLLSFFLCSIFCSIIPSIIFSVATGFSKEVYDYFRDRSHDRMDFIWTIFGTFIGALLRAL